MSIKHSSHPSASQLTYSDYLRVSELTRLQRPQSAPPHHDQLLVVLLHQTYELGPKRRLHEPSLRDVFFAALAALGTLPQVGAEATEAKRVQARAQAILVLYRDERGHRDWIDVCERLTEFDELLVSWRLRHIQMVERTVGMRTGTGGSSGV